MPTDTTASMDDVTDPAVNSDEPVLPTRTFPAWRLWLWRHGILALPATPGWQRCVQAVAAVEVYTEHRDDIDAPIFGAPLEWSLYVVQDRRLVPARSTCLWSGVEISGATPLCKSAGGVPAPDLRHYGVRCCRCGAPLHVRHAGMRVASDIPSCPPCRPKVKKELSR